MDTMTKSASTTASISTDILLTQWLGHRNLTRRVIEVFPEDKIFNHTIGGMRTPAQLVTEMLTMGVPGIRGVVQGKWESYKDVQESFQFKTKQELLKLWDAATEEIKSQWTQIPVERFHEMDKFFGQYEGPIYWSILYLIDNEIHHRGQMYVYLRSLGIEPPPFWDRS
jgi:uncharacterized damage-inducible protein DinB